ncbi:MAG: hypothetical protein ABIC57_00795 [bacterium]
MEIYFIITAIVVSIFALILLGGGSRQDKEEIEKELYSAEKMMAGDISRIKEGVIKFDNLLNKSLQIKGFRGQTLADRLKASQKFFQWSDYSGIWEAHKLRNRIVHENYDPSGMEIKKTVKYFKLAVKKLIK